MGRLDIEVVKVFKNQEESRYVSVLCKQELRSRSKINKQINDKYSPALAIFLSLSLSLCLCLCVCVCVCVCVSLSLSYQTKEKKRRHKKKRKRNGEVATESTRAQERIHPFHPNAFSISFPLDLKQNGLTSDPAITNLNPPQSPL